MESNDEKETLAYRRPELKPRVNFWAVISFGLSLLFPMPCVFSMVAGDSKIGWFSVSTLVGMAIALTAFVAGMVGLVTGARSTSGLIRGTWMAWVGVGVGFVFLGYGLLIFLFFMAARM